jgi:hypothetical protein
MAKRSIEAYRPVGLAKALDPDHRYVSSGYLDKLIEVGGPLPNRPFEISGEERGRLVPLTVSARDKFDNELERAARAYHLAKEEQVKPTATQLAAHAAAIEKAARQLLLALGAGLSGNLERMPDALRYGGLQAFAEIEAKRLEAAAQNRAEYPADEFWAPTRLRRAVEGVAAIHRWAKAMKAHKLASKRLEGDRLKAAGKAYARYAGDKPLNDYLGSVVASCWLAICGREIADGPQLWRFGRVAAAAVGVKLSNDASRERIRRVFKLREGKSS